MLAYKFIAWRSELRHLFADGGAFHKEGAPPGFEGVGHAEQRFVHHLKGAGNDSVHRRSQAVGCGFMTKNLDILEAEFLDHHFQKLHAVGAGLAQSQVDLGVHELEWNSGKSGSRANVEHGARPFVHKGVDQGAVRIVALHDGFKGVQAGEILVVIVAAQELVISPELVQGVFFEFYAIILQQRSKALPGGRETPAMEQGEALCAGRFAGSAGHIAGSRPLKIGSRRLVPARAVRVAEAFRHVPKLQKSRITVGGDLSLGKGGVGNLSSRAMWVLFELALSFLQGESMNMKSVVLAGLVLAGFVQAKNYGMAGCGLGSLVLGKSGNQVLAATTNGTVGNQTFGITTGTLNCTDDGVAMSDREQELFTEANFEILKQEIAQGQGENIYALASLMGCDESQSQVFSSSLQARGSDIVSDSPQSLLFSIRAVEANQNICTGTR